MAKKTIAANAAKTNKKEAIHMATKERDFSQIIVRDDNGNKYTLEYNRRSVERMEKSGFKLDTDYPHTMITGLFQGAFLMHKKGMTPDRIKEIWDAQTSKDKLLEGLTQLYMKPLNDLMEDPEGKADDNPTWETA